MRVAFVNHSVEPGGAELALKRVLSVGVPWHSTLLLPRNLEATLGVFDGVAPDVAVEFVGPVQAPGASRVRGPLAALRFAIGVLRQSIALRRSAGFREADVVHANSTRAGLYTALAATFSRKRVVLHLRDVVSPEALGTVGFHAFSRVALPRASAVVANSQWTLDSAIPYLDRECVRVVLPSPSGLPEPRPLVDVPRHVSRIGMVARIVAWKGQRLLLRAFADAFRGTSVMLVIVGGADFGEDQEREDLEALAVELGIERQVDFLGHVSDVWPVISTLDICVQASLRPEPMGQNVLQYLWAGKPIVATGVGGPAEWIEHERNGLLFQLGSLEGLSACLKRLSTDKALLGRLARGAASTQVSSDREFTAGLSRLYESLASPQGK